MRSFDPNDSKNLGRPAHFSMQSFVIAIQDLIKADEIETARYLLDHAPGWYRENGAPELEDIRNVLDKNSYDIFDYSDDIDERSYTLDGVRAQIASGYLFPRLNVVDDFIVEQNSKCLFPWIYEISPSHGPLPIALMDKLRSFNFCGKNMNHLATERFKQWLKPAIWADEPTQGQPTVLVCYEVLEHAHSLESVKQAIGKVRPANSWDHVFLSVPYLCLGHGLPNWHNRRLGHIRTFTQKEFSRLADDWFPGRKWQMVVSHSLVLHGN